MHNALYTMFFLIILVLSISAAAIVLALVARHILGYCVAKHLAFSANRSGTLNLHYRMLEWMCECCDVGRTFA